MDNFYSSTYNMSARGRFSARGGSSYRGGGRGESSYRGSSRGGGYSTPRGYSNARGRGSYYPKYENSASKYNSDGGRYGSHARMEETPYRKPDSSSYSSSRDHSHHRSEIDMSRKRIRTDSYSQSQGATPSRRSNEVDDYRGSGSRYSTSNSFTESRSYTENRGVFKKPRLSEYKPKETYRGRKEISRSSLPLSKLRSLRGRSIRGRAWSLRRGGDSFPPRKRAALSGSRTTSELLALRRTRFLKLKRLRERTQLRLSEERAVLEDKKKEVKAAEEEEEKKTEKEEKKEENAADESKDKEKEKTEEGEICDGDAENKDKAKKSDETTDYSKKTFAKLQCPQCNAKCTTIDEYREHLYLPSHIKALRDKSEQLKQTLAKMRNAQRNDQKKMDEEDVTSMSTRSTFCHVCKLCYSQDKTTHQTSEAHKKLKEFLQPYCKICRIPFKSPMIYERHICSLDHIRRKLAMEERSGKAKGSSHEYLDSFMVLDSVGSGDEVEDVKDKKNENDTGKRTKKSEDMNLGVEFIRKVEAFFCEVCRTYLPRMTDQERVLKVHCRTKYHLKSYLRFGTDQLLEKIARKKAKSDGSAKKNSDEKTEGEKENENHEGGEEDEGGIDAKVWADVTNILSQIEPEAKSDEDDDDEGGRFDRFKSNEKKENGEVGSEEGHEDKEKPAAAGEENKEEAQK